MIKIFSLLLILFNLNSAEKSLIEEYLHRQLNDYSSFEYEIISNQGSVYSEFEIDATRKFKVKNDYAYIPVVINNNGGSSRSYLTAKVKLYKKVFIAERRIAKGEKLSTADFSFTEMDVTGYRSPVEYLYTDLTAKVSIAEGTLLEQWMIKESPVIGQSEVVKAFAQFGSVEVEFKVKTREEGKPGDVIRVVRDDRRMFSAEVIDSSTVKILE